MLVWLVLASSGQLSPLGVVPAQMVSLSMSLAASKMQVSQASPRRSPSLSSWSLLLTDEQLSERPQMPSASMSLVLSVGQRSQALPSASLSLSV